MGFFSEFSTKETMTCFMVLFAVIDILGSVPVIVALRKQIGTIQSGKASLVSAGLMIVFLFLGDSLLRFIGIDINSFAVAGSMVIFIIAVEMILGIEIQKTEKEHSSSASIVPIAFPLIAGAGTLTTILSLRAEYHVLNIIIAVVLNTAVVYAVLKTASIIEKKLGEGALVVLKKVFGVVLLAISIKLFTSNFFPLVAQYLNFGN